MKIKDQVLGIRRLTEKELSVKIVENQKKLIIKQQEKLLGKMKNTAELNSLKKEIARMKTILDEKIAAQINKETTDAQN